MQLILMQREDGEVEPTALERRGRWKTRPYYITDHSGWFIQKAMDEASINQQPRKQVDRQTGN